MVALEVGGLITLEHGVSIPRVLARVVRWCTRGAVLIIASAVGCVDVWCVGLFTIGMSHVFLLKISPIFASACALYEGCRSSSLRKRLIAVTRDAAMRLVSSIGVSFGTMQCCG